MLRGFFERQRREFPWQLRGTLELEASRGFRKKKERFHVEASYQPPGSFRMDFLNPFGLNQASLLIKKPNVLLFHPSQNKAFFGQESRFPLVGSPKGLSWLKLARMLIGWSGLDPHGHPRVKTSPDGIRWIWNTGQTEWFIGTCGEEPCEIGKIMDNEERTLIEGKYTDFILIEQLRLAKRACLSLADKHVRIKLWLEEITLPQRIEDEAFQIPIGTSTAILNFDQISWGEMFP